ncbi:MAG: PCRF domain-containing protein, partial [Bacteroidales bacterium]|nr:PCRF domain-containing protein [Bacteroidales bacterium]
MDRRTIEASELEEKTQDPQFWNDPKAAELTMKKMREVKAWINGYKNADDAYNDLAVLVDFFKEGEATEEEVDNQYAAAIAIVEALEFKNMLREEADPLSCVLKINAGAGGTEAQDWA